MCPAARAAFRRRLHQRIQRLLREQLDTRTTPTEVAKHMVMLTEEQEATALQQFREEATQTTAELDALAELCADSGAPTFTAECRVRGNTISRHWVALHQVYSGSDCEPVRHA